MEKYFGAIPSASKAEPLVTVEPKQFDERRVTLRESTQPLYLEGYHRPSYLDPDDAVYDVISDLLSEGRTSRLYRSLVRDKKIAAVAAGFPLAAGYVFVHFTPGRGWLSDSFVSESVSVVSRLAASTEVVAALTIGSLAVGSATFLILEMDRPYDGLIRLSNAPLRAAIEQIGR